MRLRTQVAFTCTLLSAVSLLRLVQWQNDEQHEQQLLWALVPTGLEDQCATLRSIRRTPPSQESSSVGLEFLDRPDFISVGRGTFHLFHFLEFVVIAFAELEAQQHHAKVDWIYVPMLNESELSGVQDINHIIAEMLWGSSLDWYGLHANSRETLRLHPVYTGEDPTHAKRHALVDPETHTVDPATRTAMVSTEAVWIVSREHCHRTLNKMWIDYIDRFPAAAWHRRVVTSLGVPPPSRFSVCYVDRQNTKRKLPDVYHEWILSAFEDSLRHLHMEDLSPMEQLRTATQCSVLLGGHGNGLSHMFWMAPQSAVVELFWEYPFQFDYLTAALLMEHEYLALWNGEPLDGERVRSLDPTLFQLNTTLVVDDGFPARVQVGFDAIREHVDEARRNFEARLLSKG